LKNTTIQKQQFIEYLESYKNLIVKVARMYCSDLEVRKDLVQEISIQLWKAYPKYNPEYSLSTWTYRIALNVCISYLRKENSKNKINTLNEYPMELIQWEENPVDEKMEQLYASIAELKPIDKAIITLFLEGCKYKEIAEVIGTTPTNISTRMLRIKETLSKKMKPLKN
jgi:RNA polymerase sigma-70 factor (ECF subfamily)